MYNHRGEPTGTNFRPVPQRRFFDVSSPAQAHNIIAQNNSNNWEAPNPNNAEGVRYFEGAPHNGRNIRVSRDNQYITSTRETRLNIHHVPSNTTASVPFKQGNKASKRKVAKTAKRYLKSGIVSFDDKNS